MEVVQDAELDWIRHGTAGIGMTLGTALPAGFAVYGVLDVDRDSEREQDLVLLASLGVGADEPLISGVLLRNGLDENEPGTEHELYAHWSYRFRRRTATEIRDRITSARWSAWRFPEILFPSDRRFLVSTLWDDSWRSVGADGQTADRIAAALPTFERVGRDVDLRTTGREPY